MNSRNYLIRIVLLSLLLYAVGSLFSSGQQLRLSHEKEAELSAALAELRRDNLQMQQRLEESISDEELIQLARQKLGLVLPGEKIFYFTTDREEQHGTHSGWHLRG